MCRLTTQLMPLQSEEAPEFALVSSCTQFAAASLRKKTKKTKKKAPIHPNALCGLFTRWMRDISREGLRKCSIWRAGLQSLSLLLQQVTGSSPPLSHRRSAGKAAAVVLETVPGTRSILSDASRRGDVWRRERPSRAKEKNTPSLYLFARTSACAYAVGGRASQLP